MTNCIKCIFVKICLPKKVVLLVFNKGWFGAKEALHGCWNVSLKGCKKHSQKKNKRPETNHKRITNSQQTQISKTD